ncbi:carboxymuconolactone decarboxylase family protein [Stenotrophomonas sp. NPDC087984]
MIDTADPGGTTLLQLLRLRLTGEGALPDAVAAKLEPLMTKDLDAARALAAELGIAVPLVDVARQRTPQTLDQQTEPADAPRARGLELMDKVYGPGFSDTVPKTGEPYLNETVEHLFADIWSRPGLSVRDRRLLTMGVGASLGRTDLIRIQARGALHNHELTPDQLREAVLHLAYYVGWCNATAAHQGVTDAIADVSPTKEA